ncbi:MAG: nucleotidyltransferase domain-containing protein [Bacteroidales bacterium]|jgi:predicted nucleotidyltransferase|nr:nucleotidyltransferase domain-containing protein [Bacteroidales bacterium]
MFGLDEDLRSKFNKIFASFPEIEKVIIYGSRAKGNYREGSDIDLCLVGDDLKEAIRKRVWLMLDELNTPYLIDLSVFNQLESEGLIGHIQRVGAIFYRKQNE